MNATIRSLWLGGLIAILFAGCGDDPAPAPAPCGADEVRDDAGTCIAATPTCTEGVPGSIRATCFDENRACFDAGAGASCTLCLDGFVEEAGSCRPVKTCAGLDCSNEWRTCVESGSRSDAQCGACLPGAEGVAEGCVPRTCEAGVEGSITADCAGRRRSCVEAPEEFEAHCGTCWSGFADRGGTCQPVRSCTDLGCVQANRTCTPAGVDTDATCGDCAPGTRAIGGGACTPIADASCDAAAGTDISAACEAAGRTCDVSISPARCGACLGDTVDDPETGTCVARLTCAELDCAAANRSCDELPNGHCGSCLPGYTVEPGTGACRPVRSCSQISCDATETCVLPGDHADAVCQPDCGANGIWGGMSCQPCPPCGDTGEEGRWPTPNLAGSCLCRTAPGFFYSTAGDVGSFACDADGDGWIRESARLALESDDPALRENARCQVRTIDRFVLVNEAGERHEVVLNDPLPLFESDRNDDDTLLSISWQVRGLPGYGGAGSIPSARELNRLTKLCHDPRTDYNDNGVPDVNEWNGHARAPIVRPEQAPFNEFSYFAELHTGRWIAPVAGGTHGAWEIREKSRAALTAEPERPLHVPMAYPDEDGGHWRTCDVDRDPRFGVIGTAVGLDFAVHSNQSERWSGMNHHSQFKCMVFENEPVPELPQQITPAGAAARGYRLNQCRAAGPAAAPAEINPALTDVACAPIGSNSVRPGDVAWAAIPYVDYGLHLPGTTYAGGCVNDCVLQYPRCPGYDINPEGVSCAHDADDFGRFLACDAFEVCDGLDNDFDGVADNGNPGGGFPCDTGEHGVCGPGTTICRAGTIQCDRNIQPSTEQCNGIDDDCDGQVDESFPEDGADCTVAGQQGICARSNYTCAAGNLECNQTVQPTSESCNGLDDNCNGQVDEGDDNDSCTDYYLDEDGDGWGNQAARRCLCAPDRATDYDARAKHRDGTIAKQPFAFDCCDRDDRAYPGATTYRSSPNSCGSFDYDCNGTETSASNSSVAAGCGTCCSGFCCCDARVGWANSVPACGQTATWFTDSCSSWSSCSQRGDQRTRSCR